MIASITEAQFIWTIIGTLAGLTVLGKLLQKVPTKKGKERE